MQRSQESQKANFNRNITIFTLIIVLSLTLSTPVFLSVYASLNKLKLSNRVIQPYEIQQFFGSLIFNGDNISMGELEKRMPHLLHGGHYSPNKAILQCEKGQIGGSVVVMRDDISMKELESQFPQVLHGGRYSSNIRSTKEKVAIIVPMRDREHQLRIWLRHMHTILIRQQRDYRVFVIEQTHDTLFNKGKLLNVGFHYASKARYNCFVFNDIDTLPENDRNLYSCENQPTHLSPCVEKNNYALLYSYAFGGVIALTDKQYKRVNGFSNNYYGWGAEDDDLSLRVTASGKKINRRPPNIGRFSSLYHESNNNPKNISAATLENYNHLNRAWKSYPTNKTFLNEGLNTLSYHLEKWDEFKLFTRILVKC